MLFIAKIGQLFCMMLIIGLLIRIGYFIFILFKGKIDYELKIKSLWVATILKYILLATFIHIESNNSSEIVLKIILSIIVWLIIPNLVGLTIFEYVSNLHLEVIEQVGEEQCKQYFDSLNKAAIKKQNSINGFSLFIFMLLSLLYFF